MSVNVDRRKFLTGSAALVAASACQATESVTAEDPFRGTQGVPLKVGAPCLQAPGETTMGVSWSVSGLSKGVVEYADNPDFRGGKVAYPGGLGLIPIDTATIQVRLEGLRPATR